MEGCTRPPEQKPEPEDLSLYGQFSVSGYQFTAYMPNHARQPLEWTVLVTKGDEIIRKTYLAMEYEPRFGPDVADIARLNESVGAIISELMLGI